MHGYKLTFAMIKCLIHTLVFSRLIYCCSLFCNLPVNLMYKLERIHRNVICVLCKINSALIVSMSALLRSLGWLICIYMCLLLKHIINNN